MQQYNETDSPPRLHTVAQFSQRFPAWTPAAIRALIYAAEDRVASGGRVIKGTGLADAGVIVRVGRRVLIDEQAFFRWIAEQQRTVRRAARPATPQRDAA
jgi:hypothetical protein